MKLILLSIAFAAISNGVPINDNGDSTRVWPKQQKQSKCKLIEQTKRMKDTCNEIQRTQLHIRYEIAEIERLLGMDKEEKK